MATMKPVTVRWKGDGLLFVGETAHGRVDMASSLDAPGQGPTPMELVAVALAGCTGIDIVSILQKMRQPLEDVRIEVGGEKADEHPGQYVSLDVTYHLRGELDAAKVERAIRLSEEKYCSVEATLRPAVRIASSYVIER